MPGTWNSKDQIPIIKQQTAFFPLFQFMLDTGTDDPGKNNYQPYAAHKP